MSNQKNDKRLRNNGIGDDFAKNIKLSNHSEKKFRKNKEYQQ